MSKTILQLFIALVVSLNIQAQSQEIVVKINHLLDGETYASGLEAYNNMNHKFMLNRLEYYLSEIAVLHDNGQEMMIDDLWVLANANDGTTTVELGTLDVGTIEGLSFHIGVDPDHNHLDPTIWAISHPLGPKAPSMHWGWAAGYRFVALEGYGGSQLNQKIEIHGLGDNNYGKATVRRTSIEEDGKQVIYIDADYTKALENISVQSGLIVHADNNQAAVCLSNFRNQVFTAGMTTTSNNNLFDNGKFTVFPNPGPGILKIQKENNETELSEIMILDMTGKVLNRIDGTKINEEISIDYPGHYLMMFRSEEKILGINKVTVIK
ncbi:MAG: T9SS type A sorting domain-containing protein [Saprospiraceae bacterium]|nr:T9SS type A sorting domain-containing protein [Saprospiraceae bacterium]